MTNNVGLTCSVGDTILRFTISIEQDNNELIKGQGLRTKWLKGQPLRWM